MLDIKQRSKNDKHMPYTEKVHHHKFEKNVINWKRYKINEHNSIQRCFNGQEFYHKSDTHPNEKKYGYCAGNYSINDCPKTQKRI